MPFIRNPLANKLAEKAARSNLRPIIRVPG